jgi:hypothetical protein
MILNTLLEQLVQQPENVEFDQVIHVIAEYYKYTPTRFCNGPELVNEAGTNEGSCKIFAFALQQQLNKDATLACFGQYYRKDVLENLSGDDHGNIRSFMVHGWDGIKFDQKALARR